MKDEPDARATRARPWVCCWFSDFCQRPVQEADSDGAAPNADSFKGASVDNQQAGAGLTTLIELPFTAPSNGFASISATGNCAVVEPLPVNSVLVVEIETTPTDQTPQAGRCNFPDRWGTRFASAGFLCSVARSCLCPPLTRSAQIKRGDCAPLRRLAPMLLLER